MPRIILRPALVTLLIHGLLLYLLTANWEATEREIIRAKPAPNVINARLVDISEISKPKAAPPKPKAVTVKPKSKPKATPPKPKAVTPKPKLCAAQAESYTQAKVQADASKADAASAK